MLIAQISDLHIVKKDEKTIGVAPMDENLLKCIAHINQLEPKPNVVLVSGDITHSLSLEEAQYAAQLLKELHAPYYIVPGNHDSREAFWQVFGGNACPENIDGMINYTLEDFPVRIIALDSTKPKTVGGDICQKRLDWLDARLAENMQKPTLIFMHHPPVKVGVLEADYDGFAGAGALGAIIEKYNNIERIVCGHIHLTTHTKWHGTIVSTAPSMGMQLGLDLTMKKPSEFILEAPGYLLHHLTPQNDLVTHTIYVREIDGPYSFG